MPSSISTEEPRRAAPRILVVEDDRSAQRILVHFLERHGFEVVATDDGESAIELYERTSPDLAVVDIGLPGIDGFEVTRHIKTVAAGAYAPVILLTANRDDTSIEAAIVAGADDYVPKPFRPALLLHRISSCMRTHELFSAVAAKRAKLEELQAIASAELAHAEWVLSRILESSAHDERRVEVYSRPMNGACGGDLFLAERTPAGTLRFMLADSTGHGLTAAICTLPLICSFKSTTKGGVSLRGAVTAINEELARILPTGHFVAAIVAELDPLTSRLQLWNAGMPQVCIRSAEGELSRLALNSAPLAIFPRLTRRLDLHDLVLPPGSAVCLFSDGMFECRDENGTPYGEERLLADIGASCETVPLFERIVGAHEGFVGRSHRDDDACFVMICGGGEPEPREPAVCRQRLRELKLSYSDSGLKDALPGRTVAHEVGAWPGVGERAPMIGMVVSELFANSLDHGVLGLESCMRSAQGFSSFVETRRVALEQARGTVTVGVALFSEGPDRSIEIAVEDTGAGWDQAIDFGQRKADPHGRGLNLLRHLCTSLRVEGGGARVVATIRWLDGSPADFEGHARPAQPLDE